MKNRSSYAVLTRFGIIAAILATLVLIAPVATATTQEYTVDENTTDPIARFSATDQEGDEITWGLDGDDKGDFVISEAGVLSFKENPNYESPADADEDNVYMVTVTASSKSKATQDVQVTVMDIDEAGSVSFSGLGRYQPQVDRSLEASLSDPDTGEPTDVTWQWARGPNMDGPWTDIDGATTADRSPTADDYSYYLRVTATYNDKFNEGDQKTSASVVSEEAVEEKTLSNAAPDFSAHDTVPDVTGSPDTIGVQATREVDENAEKTNVGKPLTASDGDNDTLFYELVDPNPNGPTDILALFSIDPRTGQIKTKDGIDSSATGSDSDDREDMYVARVRATDPSGAVGTASVTIVINNINDAPAFAEQEGTDTANGPKATVAENTTTLHDDGNTGSVPTYTATDDDGDTPLTYAVTGADSGSFFIATTGGALAFCSADNAGTRDDDDCTKAHTPNYEDRSSYSISITADDGNDGVGKVDVSVAVTNANDAGEVSLNQREPQVDRPVTANIEDPDGSISNLRWQWYWDNDSALAATDFDTTPADCTAASAGLCTISGANSPTYTPKAVGPHGEKARDSDRWWLVARARYMDKVGEDVSQMAPEAAVQASNPANTAPKFAKDNDPNTPGDQGDVERSVAENDKGANVGAPVTVGTDPEGDLEMYTISGDDASSFKIGRDDGQITTAVELDYEMKDSYTIVVTATDPSGATGSTNVNITVTDAEDPGVIMGEEAHYTVDENTSALGSYTATDQDADDTTITWGVSGDDKDAFTAEGGVLMFKDAPSYEAKADADGDNVYMVNVTANGGSFAVEVTVEDVDEPGKVTLNRPQPQVSRTITADGADSDPDKPVTEAKWQWSRGPTMDGPWTDIDKATQNTRTPDSDDEGMYLRATVTYNDKFNEGEQTTSASAVSENPVEPRTLANSLPTFTDEDTDTAGTQVNREVDENKKGENVGKPVVAKDPDPGDILLYTLADGSTGALGTQNDIAEEDLYEVDERTGQITTKVAIDVNPDAADTANATHTVIITATDPSGAATRQPVTITVNDVNDAPMFVDFDTGTDGRQAPPKTLYVTEIATPGNPTDKVLRTTEASPGTPLAPATYTVDDDDSADVDGTFTYALEGADKDKFHISETGVLTVCTADAASCGTDNNHDPDYETKKSYSITIVGMDDEEAAASIDVTVMVVNAEDAGTVKLNRREPQVDQSVVATLTDPDGSLKNVSWQWYWDTIATVAGEAFPTTGCDENSSERCLISGATSPSYTPTEVKPGGSANANAPDQWFLTARVSYTDGLVTDTGDDGDDGDNAHKSPERGVQAARADNTAPEFPSDTDPNMDGNQDTYEFTVPENKKGEVVKNLLHSAVTATDDDEDLLLYSLSGADAESFTIVSGIDGPTDIGTIKTAVELDFETKSSYTVIATATDPSGASDSITVNITVTDEDDAPVITPITGGGGEPDADHPCVVGGAVTAEQGENLAADCQTLLDAMAELIGDGDATLNWSMETPIGEWQGVAQRGTGRVGGVQLADMGLAGMIPASFNDLVGLQVLNLRDNDLTGGIPDLSALDNLTILNLKGNMLSGDIPATLADMDMLDYLWLYDNDLTGEIPAQLGSVATLRQIRLHNNGLTGEIPIELGGIARLRYLTLSNNMLTGEIPAKLGNATNLKALWLNSNMLTGEIPVELGSIMTDADDTLRLLYLSHNMLTGDIPSELGNLVSLTAGSGLRLSGNDLTGCIPAAIFGAASDAAAAGLEACP